MKSIVLVCPVLVAICFIGCSNSSKGHSVNTDSIAAVTEKEATSIDEAKGDVSMMMAEIKPLK